MIAYDLLKNDDKEKLIERIISLDQEVERLRKENEQLKIQIEKSNPTPQSGKKPKSLKNQKKKSRPPHEWGRKAGHPGCTRPKPGHIDREVSQELNRCPKCNRALGKAIGVIEHIQEDIIPSRVEVTQFKKYQYCCCGCGERITAPYAPDEVPYGYLGPKVLSMMVWLKYYHCLPGNKIKELLKDFCQLTVSEGAIAKALQRLAKYLHTETAVILEGIRKAPYKHGDETGWKINGIGHWLWTMVNKDWSYFYIHKSRGSKVVKELLGESPAGVLISDFFSAYNKLKVISQKCLIHLRREMRNAKGNDPPDSFLKPYKKLKRILDDADRLAVLYSSMEKLSFIRRVRRIKKRLFDFACESYSHKFWQRLSKRLLKHEKSLFTFLDYPGLPSHNNTAERAIRPHVILRNRSFQNRTDNGAFAHSTLTSIMQTLISRKQDGISSLASAYVKHRQGFDKPILFQ